MMETNIAPKKRYRQHFTKNEIPKSLIYEMYDGKPMYYKGYKDVLNKLKTPEEIMGQSDIQFIIVNTIFKFLVKNIDDKKYIVGSNETGFHLSKNVNISSDIVIFDKNSLINRENKGKYFDIPPLAVLEIDIEADALDFGMSEFNYYSMKTKKLLDFGVKEVFWFFSASKQVAIARPNQDWIIANWDKELIVLNDYKFTLEALLEKDGFNL
jgi:Uma2 family endonuclease